MDSSDEESEEEDQFRGAVTLGQDQLKMITEAMDKDNAKEEASESVQEQVAD